MENKKPNLLNTAAFLFITVVLLVMLIQWLFSPAYKLTNQELASQLGNHKMWMMPSEIKDIILEGRFENYLMVDLRDPDAYSNGTLPEAINIPFECLMESSSLDLLDKGITLMLFSDKESTSAAAGLLLKSQGFENIRMIANDFDFIINHVLNQYRPTSAFSHQEKARFDYNRYFKQSPREVTGTTPGIPPGPANEVVTVQGGC